ncbi:Uncharacterised protein [Mycobacteroides abscessus subsp. abscessus]|nr:Uncharacterised protein [Mycobacteroides abscessus subsp. abscessus]
MRPIWLISTYRMMAAPMVPNCLRRSSTPHSGRRSMPSRRIAGSSTSAWVTTPSVTPTPRTSSFGSLIRTGSSVISPGVNA